MTAYLKAIAYYLPSTTLSNQALIEEFPEWSIEKIANKIGVSERRIAASDEFCSDMAVKAANKLFDEHRIDRTEIDFLLLCTQSPDYILPTTACIIQEKLGLPTSVGALDFNLGCSGFVYGLSLAKGLIAGNMAKNVLLITSDTYSKIIHPKDKGNRTIFGDAAAAALVTRDEGLLCIDNFIFGTDGRGAENLIVKNGGSRNRNITASDTSDEFGNTSNDNNLFMNGAEIFNFTSESVPLLTSAILKKAGIGINDIDLFVFHQANAYMLEHLRKKIAIPENKFFLAMNHCGNTVSSSIPIALSEAIYRKKISKTSKVLLAGFGVGYSWAGCTLS